MNSRKTWYPNVLQILPNAIITNCTLLLSVKWVLLCSALGYKTIPQLTVCDKCCSHDGRWWFIWDTAIYNEYQITMRKKNSQRALQLIAWPKHKQWQICPPLVDFEDIFDLLSTTKIGSSYNPVCDMPVPMQSIKILLLSPIEPNKICSWISKGTKWSDTPFYFAYSH